VCDHYPGLVRLRLQNRTDERIELGVDQNNMLAMVERLQDHTGCGFDGTCHFHEKINGTAGGQHRRIVSQHW